MSRVPRPFPLVTPNDLLTGSLPSPGRAPSRASSVSSVKSATGLLSQVQIQPYNLPVGSPSNYSPSIQSQGPSVPRTVPKKLFIVTTDAASVSSDALLRARREQPLRRGVSYGAMGGPAHPRPVGRPSIPGTPSVYSGSSVATPPASAVVPVAASTRSPSTRPSVRLKPVKESNVSGVPQGSSPTMFSVNPFRDTPPRNPSPESFYSQISMRSTPANPDVGSGSYSPPSRPYGGYFTPYFSYSSNGSLVSIPPQLHLGKSQMGRLSNPSMPYMASSQVSNVSYPGTPSSTPTLTARNASVHSLVPSLHIADPHTSPDVPVDVAPRAPPPLPLSAPPAAYMRTVSGDPLRGLSKVRIPASGRTNAMSYGGNVRRYGNVQGTRSGNESAGSGYGYGAPVHGYGAPVHGYFTGGVGRDYAGQTQPGTPPTYTRRIAQVYGGANDAPWREMVMRAANS